MSRQYPEIIYICGFTNLFDGEVELHILQYKLIIKSLT